MAAKIKHVEALRLYRMGWTDGQIGDVFGVRKQAVLRWRRSRGLAANHPSDGSGVVNQFPVWELTRKHHRKPLHLVRAEHEARCGA